MALAVDAAGPLRRVHRADQLTIVPIRRHLSNRAIDVVPRQESAGTDTPVSTGEGEAPGEHCPTS
ncbi:hypothetical protein DXZ75_26240 [Streptomyces sp. AcE210]|nr:hypothetical protein DXZ75_26240 [Streptomyces sp. AcE210]